MSDVQPIRVLLVEDDDADAALFETMARQVINGSLRLERVRNAYEAMTSLRSALLPHAVVIDLNLGADSGGAQLHEDLTNDSRFAMSLVLTWSHSAEQADYSKAEDPTRRMLQHIFRHALQTPRTPFEVLAAGQEAQAERMDRLQQLVEQAAKHREQNAAGVSKALDNIELGKHAFAMLEQGMDAKVAAVQASVTASIDGLRDALKLRADADPAPSTSAVLRDVLLSKTGFAGVVLLGFVGLLMGIAGVFIVADTAAVDIDVRNGTISAGQRVYVPNGDVTVAPVVNEDLDTAARELAGDTDEDTEV